MSHTKTRANKVRIIILNANPEGGVEGGRETVNIRFRSDRFGEDNHALTASEYRAIRETEQHWAEYRGIFPVRVYGTGLRH
ncbi:hypothetical protein CMI48_03095 [Candidatus Pacearchaeota archaeon]|nr:hypothetical protein [Candidatus Pacearchaeota archaeon]